MKTVIRNENKLPDWAKNKIEKLEADVIYWKRKADQINGDEDTNTFVEYGFDNTIALPKNAAIKFDVNGKKVTVKIHGESIKVHYDSFSSTNKMVIAPEVSNAFLVLFTND